MALLGMQDVNIAFGGPPVLDRASFAIERGERVCLLGRNGAGKSTLMKLLDGTMLPDGARSCGRPGVTVARLEQEVPDDVEGTTFDVVAAGLGPSGALLARYHDASHRVATDAQRRRAARARPAAPRARRRRRVADADRASRRCSQHLGLDADAPFAQASGGRKRQTLLARALVRQPDVLLLDEPTNHLDVDAIEWMEEFLIDRGTTLLFVTHDRAFLRRVATRIVELDRGRLVDWGADYDTYLERKEAALAAEASEWEEFDKKLAKEEVWIRTGIQARRTRNEGRVRALEALRVERERAARARRHREAAGAGGRAVGPARRRGARRRASRAASARSCATSRRRSRAATASGSSARTAPARRRCSACCSASSRPTRARSGMGTGLEVAYFDQLREQLDPERSVFDSIADGADFVEIGGQRKHVHGYLQDFLFPPDRARTPVRALSGGERNRLLLARLFTRSFNLLVLDEPTNDLDIETLDLLEELLLEFSGTLLIVSHDRAFLDNVVTSTLVFEGGGRIGEYVGGYTDWVRQRKVNAPVVAPAPARRPSATPAPPRATKQRRLSFKEKGELAVAPRSDRREGARARADATSRSPTRRCCATPARSPRHERGWRRSEAELAALTARWEELETIAAES